ncbi:monooxygenase [Penicillium angulare]|uniref:monooxygenase n=1 Tax=Penicillium angulare TaxID=116970 RepID=UPI00253F8C8D|nr:monooxygenase [Penicillium angulare]KAJ5273508.1 monooxygenase [Penicillium angulare]
MKTKVLICGAGCAGTALAFWLARAGHNVTVIERSPSLRALGAQIDIRNQGIEVINRMGLLEILLSKLVKEEGTHMVNSAGEVKAAFGKGNLNATAEYEIMRGDLVKMLYEATQDHENIEYIFGKMVESFDERENENDNLVHFSDGSTDSFDLLVGADGQGSRIRSAILPPGGKEYRKLGIWAAYWFVPRIETDTNTMSMYSSPGGRLMLRRSHNSTETQVYCIFRDDENTEQLNKLMRAPAEEQKKYWKQKFHDAGWETDRFIAGIDDTANFYCHEVVQVIAANWVRGRVALIGDAAHCPSPLTGLGTTTSLIGAYVLAGEITRSPDDLALALKNYERVLRPLIKEVQVVGPLRIKMALPQSQWVITLRLAIMGFLCWLGIPDLLSQYVTDTSEWQLPHYPALDL